MLLKMGNILVLIFATIFCYNQEIKITKVVVKKVDFDITTIISIGCNNFESAFKEQLNVITIDSKNELKQLQNFLEGIKPDPENYFPDVRAKLEISYSDGSLDTICLSNLGMVFNGKSILLDVNILDFVESQR